MTIVVGGVVGGGTTTVTTPRTQGSLFRIKVTIYKRLVKERRRGIGKHSGSATGSILPKCTRRIVLVVVTVLLVVVVVTTTLTVVAQRNGIQSLQ